MANICMKVSLWVAASRVSEVLAPASPARRWPPFWGAARAVLSNRLVAAAAVTPSAVAVPMKSRRLMPPRFSISSN